MNGQKRTFLYVFIAFCIVISIGVHSCVLGMQHETRMEKYRDTVKKVTMNVLIGSTAGIAEVVCFGQLLTYVKNMVQQDAKISFNPRLFYRGFGVNVACMAPTTAIQVATNKALENIIPGEDNKTLSVRALAAGALSAVVSNPIELVILYQQNNGLTAYKSIETLVENQGPSVLMRGLQSKACRDAIFAYGLFSLYPFLKEDASFVFNNEPSATVVAGVSTGVVTGLVSHPFDTISTYMQVDYNKQKASTTMQAVYKIYQKENYKGFFKGAISRCLRLMLAIPLMSKVQEDMNNYVSLQE